MSTAFTTDTMPLRQPFYLWDSAYTPPAEAVRVDTGIPLDSIFPIREVAPAECRPSLFGQHTLEVRHAEPLPRPASGTPVWMFVLLLALGGGHYLYFRLRRLRIGELARALFDARALDRLVRGNNLKPLRLMPIGVLLSASLATAGCLFLPTMEERGVAGWMLCCAVIAVAYMLRNGVLRLLGNIFGGGESVGICINSNYLYHLALSTLLVPMLLLAAYLPTGNEAFVYILSGAVGLCLLLRLARSVNLFLTNSRSFCFYLFYYLCTVELVPLIVLARLLFVQ